MHSWCNKSLRIQTPSACAVSASNYHITTLFLGNISSHQIDSLVNELEYKLTQTKDTTTISPFEIVFDQLVAWQKPKIAAAYATDTPPELSALHQLCNQVALQLRIPLPGLHNEYRPHITLVRKVKPEHVPPSILPLRLAVKVAHLHLFESVTGNGGAQYFSRFNWPLPSSLSIRDSLRQGIRP